MASDARLRPDRGDVGLGGAARPQCDELGLDDTGAHDGQVQPSRVHDLYADLGSKSKVLIDLACSSHNAMWEKNHRLLFEASLQWLTKGAVNGVTEGTVRLGY